MFLFVLRPSKCWGIELKSFALLVQMSEGTVIILAKNLYYLLKLGFSEIKVHAKNHYYLSNITQRRKNKLSLYILHYNLLV